MKNIVSIILWIPAIVIFAILWLLGLVFVLHAINLHGKQSGLWPKWLWLWGNDEEGYPSWAEKRGIGTWFWYAIRNPVNNLRYVFKDEGSFYQKTNWSQDTMEAKEMLKASQRVAWYFRRRGWQSGYRRVWITNNVHWHVYKSGQLKEIRADIAKLCTYSEFWIGWKIGSSVPGLGFTLQWRRKRRIGQ